MSSIKQQVMELGVNPNTYATHMRKGFCRWPRDKRASCTVAWWSGGITSAVTCKLAIEKDPNVRIVFIETGSHHPDTQRFLKDCQKWYGKEIETIQSQYTDHFETIEIFKYVNGPGGARCTMALKRAVRQQWEKTNNPTLYYWGFEFDKKEATRAERVKTTQPDTAHAFPLIDAELTKLDCVKIVQDAGIEVPAMYKLGYNNNNCIGCVKGGMAYWNKIRVDFPDVFERMAKLERKLGRSCIKGVFLDELNPSRGRGTPPIVANCGTTGEGCQTQISRRFHND